MSNAKPDHISNMRNNWVIEQLAQISPGKTILDAGCGMQPYKKYCQHLNYKSQDFCQYDGSGDNNGLQQPQFTYPVIDYVCNIWEIPAPDNSFDAIICTEVLEHIPYPIEAIKDFARLLKPEGVLILSAPTLSVSHMSPYYYYHGFSDNWYNYFLKQNNLEIKKLEIQGDAFAFLAQEIVRLTTFISFLPLRVVIKAMVALLIRIPLKLLSFLFGSKLKHLSFGIHLTAVKK